LTLTLLRMLKGIPIKFLNTLGQDLLKEKARKDGKSYHIKIAGWY